MINLTMAKFNAKNPQTGEFEPLDGASLARVQSDWNESDNTAEDFIKNKPTIPAAQVNADWDAVSGVAQILNKPTLGAAAAKGVDSAPTASSTNLVESGGVATALAGKQATLTTAQQAAADSGITSAKVTQYDKDSAALPEVVDGGAKNLIVPATPGAVEGIVFTRNADDSVTVECTNITSNKILQIGSIDAPNVSQQYVLSGCTGGSSSTYQLGIYDGTTALIYQNDAAVNYIGNISTYVVRLRIIATAQTPFSGTITVKPMICTKVAWDVSQKYVPYCPSMAKLYEMIQALQAGT